MKKETKKRNSRIFLSLVFSIISLGMLSKVYGAEPTVTINKTAEWVDIEEGIGKITLTQTETVEEKVEIADYLIIYDVSGSMPIVTVNNYEPGTYNVDVGEVVNIGCKNPNHYSKLKPGASDDMDGWRNALHYDNNGTPDDTSDDILLNYTSSFYQKMNWKGDVIQTFYLSSPKEFMYSRANGCYCTLDTSQEMLNKFIDKVEEYNPNAQFAYVAFGGQVVKYNGFTSGQIVKELINISTQYEGTFYGPALEKADEILDTYKGENPVKIIFLTDGNNYAETDALEHLNRLKQHHTDVDIYAVSSDYNAQDTDDIKKIGDKYIYLTSDKVNETVSTFIDYSLSKTTVQAESKLFTDKVSEYFDIINTQQYPLSANTTFSGDTFKWYIPLNNSNQASTYQTSFYIKLKDNYRKTATDTLYETNLDTQDSNGAVLEYKISGGEYDGQTRTISHESPSLPYGLQQVSVTKVWDDYNNIYNTRPDNITLNLNKDGKIVDSKTINSTEVTFNGYREVDGKLEVYSVLYDNNSQNVQNSFIVTEDSVSNYKTEQNGTTDNNYTVKNKLDMSSELEIRYVDTLGNTLLKSNLYTGKVGQEYTTKGPEIYGYKLVNTPENASGKYVVDKTIVTYVYENVLASIKVNHIDKFTNKVLYTSTQTGIIGEEKNTTSMDIVDYILVESPQTEKYILTKTPIEVNYYYAKVNNLIVNYIDEVTNEKIIDTISERVTQGTSYDTHKKDFENYTFTRDSANTQGIVGAEDIEVTYYYKKKTNGIDVKYIDQVTKEEIAQYYHIEGLENDKYSTQKKEIEGYELVVIPDNATGVLKVENDDVIYEYRKLSKLIVNHIDANTTQQIAPTVTKEYKEGEEYEGYSVNIDGYTLVESPEDTKGVMGREDVEMTFKYKRISAGLVVKYVDEISGEVLDEDIFEGNEKDVIKLVEKEFDGYVLVLKPEEDSVELTVEPQEKIFYYKREVEINIRGIDQDTEEVLYTDSDTGLEGEEYSTQPQDIDGYKLVVVPENANGVYDLENEDIIYEYRKIAGEVTVKYVDSYTDEELDSELFTGFVGDSYETVKKTFDKYTFVSVEGQTVGKLDEQKHEVVYYYEKKKGNVVVIYEDKDGNILQQEELEGRVDDTYLVTQKDITGYTVIQKPDSLEGTYIEGTIELKFILDKSKGQIIVNFVDTLGNNLHTTIYSEDYIGENFYIQSPNIDGYNILTNQVVEKEYVDGQIVIDVVYEKIPEQEQTQTPTQEVEQDVVEETPEKEITEIAQNPNTADINVVVYLVALIAWSVGLVKSLKKN